MFHEGDSSDTCYVVREGHARAVRTHAGMFDVSHMGEVEVEGPGALAFLQLVLSNDVAKIAVGGAQYSCLCNEAVKGHFEEVLRGVYPDPENGN